MTDAKWTMRAKDTMTNDSAIASETRAFEADVSKLLHMMVHSVYSDRDVFLRELISNAADARENCAMKRSQTSHSWGRTRSRRSISC